jgi:dihydroorotate dehydrogenase
VNRYGFNSDGHLLVLARLRDRITKFFHSHYDLLPSTVFPILPAGATIDPFPVARLLSSPAGTDALLADLIHYPRSLRPGQLLAINLGKNKISGPESIDDFVAGVSKLGNFADVLVVNVSSPNTPGLRGLQQAGMIDELLSEVVKARDALPASVKPPVLVKIAPDLSEIQLDDIAQAALNSKIDGIIVANTTTSRPPSAGPDPTLAQAGGLSGPPLKNLTLPLVAELYRATDGKIPLVACGGISTGQDAVDYARAGASFVQLYTSFTYAGVGLPRRLKDEVTTILHREGKTWQQLVGTSVKRATKQQLEQEREARLAKAEEHAQAVWAQEVVSAREELTHIMARIRQEEERIALQKHALPVLIEEPTSASHAVAAQSTLPDATTGQPSSGVVKAEGVPVKLEEEQPASKVGSALRQAGSTPVPLGNLFSTFGLRKDAPKTGRRLV